MNRIDIRYLLAFILLTGSVFATHRPVIPAVDTVAKAELATATTDPIDYIGNYNSLNAALTAIGSSAKTLVINKATVINQSAVVPATLAIKIEKSGSIGLAGQTLTINGTFSAGIHQVFSGSGTVVFGKGSTSEIIPQWWAENTTPGTTDMTRAFRTAFVAGYVNNGGPGIPVRIPSGTYLITDYITTGSCQTVRFDPHVTINAALPNEKTSLFNVANQTDVEFVGDFTILNGNRAAASPEVEGNSAAFYLYGSDNVSIENMTINDFATDGITLEGDDTLSGPCRNVTIRNVVCNNNRRNGLSIVSAIGCTVIGGEFKNSNGAPHGPWAGIDIEPDADCYIENVNLNGVHTKGNVGKGILIVPAGLSAPGAGSSISVTILDGKSVNDGGFGTNLGGLVFANGGALTSEIHGNIKVDGFIIDSPTGAGVKWWNWDATYSPLTILNGVQVFDPDYSAAAVSNADKAGFLINADSAQGITSLGNIILKNCLAEDRRGTPRMSWGCLIAGSAGKTVNDVLIENFRTISQTAAESDVFTTVNATSVLNNVEVRDDGMFPLSLGAGTWDISGYGGKQIFNTGSSQYNLPRAAYCKGLSYTIHNKFKGAMFLRPLTGDTILNNGMAVNGDMYLYTYGDYIRVQSDGTNWLVTEIIRK